jgi:hypothetical protein
MSSELPKRAATHAVVNFLLKELVESPLIEGNRIFRVVSRFVKASLFDLIPRQMLIRVKM